jgi:hypothetical protein
MEESRWRKVGGGMKMMAGGKKEDGEKNMHMCIIK